MITTLHDPVVTETDGELRLDISVTYAPGTLDPGTVTYRVRPGSAAVADASVLPLVPAAVVLACRVSQDLRVDEPLPPAVHAGARRVAALLHAWYGWRPAELIAPLAAEPVRPGWAHRRRGVGAFFTRGVDSWGMLLDRLAGPRSGRPTHLITLDNEVHLARAVRDEQRVQTQRAADRIGLPLIMVETDVRALLDPHTDWGTQTHGSVLAGTGILLRRALGEVIVAPTHWTPLLRPWGSHPDLDPAWSLPDLQVVHHDGDEMRWQRVRRIVADPIAADTLLVCWQGSGPRNCGRCEKCLRLMTSLHLTGDLDRLADRFDAPFDPAAITPDLVVSPHPWCDTIDHLDRVGLRGDPLRQRWEQVQRVGRPSLWFQTRACPPRVPLAITASSGAERAAAVRSVGRRLAVVGLRIDHERSGPPAVVDGPALEIRGSRLDGWTAAAGIPVGELELADLRPVLDALGLDPAEAAPFHPDGQDPPPVVPEPVGWRSGQGDGSASHR